MKASVGNEGISLSDNDRERLLYLLGDWWLVILRLKLPSLSFVNTGLRELLALTPVSLNQCLSLLGIALLLIVVDELHKYLLSHDRVF